MDSAFTVHVDQLTPNEVMQSMRRMMLRPYLMLWVLLYALMLVIFLVKGGLTIWGWIGPAIILILLALAYEFSGRKNFKPMKYHEATLDYSFSPEGYTLTVGEQTVRIPWEQAALRRTRSDFLLYSDRKTCSILPRRCLTPAQAQQLLAWAQRPSQ